MKRMLGAVLALSMAGLLQAAEDPPLLPRSEPYVPQAQRIPAREPAPAGAELKAHAMRKLRLKFEEADTDRSGTLTQKEAQQGGLGYVSNHFEEIDSARKGAVSFEEVQAWLHRRKD